MDAMPLGMRRRRPFAPMGRSLYVGIGCQIGYTDNDFQGKPCAP